MKKKWVIIVSLIFMVVNACWVVLFVDQSLFLDDTKTELKHQQDDLNLLREIMIETKGFTTKEQFLDLFERKYSGSFKLEGENLIYVDEIGLKFDEDRFVDVVFMNK